MCFLFCTVISYWFNYFNRYRPIPIVFFFSCKFWQIASSRNELISFSLSNLWAQSASWYSDYPFNVLGIAWDSPILTSDFSNLCSLSFSWSNCLNPSFEDVHRTAGWCGNSTFNFFSRNHHSVFHNGCTGSHSHRQCTRVLISPYRLPFLTSASCIHSIHLTTATWNPNLLPVSATWLIRLHYYTPQWNMGLRLTLIIAANVFWPQWLVRDDHMTMTRSEPMICNETFTGIFWKTTSTLSCWNWRFKVWSSCSLLFCFVFGHEEEGNFSENTVNTFTRRATVLFILSLEMRRDLTRPTSLTHVNPFILQVVRSS